LPATQIARMRARKPRSKVDRAHMAGSIAGRG
jgi:hypothetical protein